MFDGLRDCNLEFFNFYWEEFPASAQPNMTIADSTRMGGAVNVSVVVGKYSNVMNGFTAMKYHGYCQNQLRGTIDVRMKSTIERLLETKIFKFKRGRLRDWFITIGNHCKSWAYP